MKPIHFFSNFSKKLLRAPLLLMLPLAFYACDTSTDGGTAAAPATPSGPTTYTVSFVTNDSGAVFTNKTVKEGEEVAKPADPTRTGYNFVNWYQDPAKTTAFDFSTKISSNTTVYAGWIVAYTVTFDMDGGPTVAAQTVGSNEKAKQPSNPSRIGYQFGGWFSDAARMSAFDFAGTAITSNTTVYAKWNINSYTVTFNVNGGSPVVAQTVTYGGKITGVSTTLSGKHLVDWYKEAAFQTVFNSNVETITADTTLYALWGDHLVTYHLDGGTQAGVGTGTTLTRGATNNHKLMVLWEKWASKSGYIFTGWYGNAGKTTYFYPNKKPITGDRAVYVKFVKKEANSKQLLSAFLNDDADNPTVAWPIEYKVKWGSF